MSQSLEWRTKWQPTPVFLPGESHGQRSLAGCSPWGPIDLDTTERLTHTHTCTYTHSIVWICYILSIHSSVCGCLCCIYFSSITNDAVLNIVYRFSRGHIFILVAQSVKYPPPMQNPGSIPGLGGFPGEGNGNPLQYSCLENPMDRGAWQATVHGISKSQTQLSD